MAAILSRPQYVIPSYVSFYTNDQSVTSNISMAQRKTVVPPLLMVWN